MSEELTMDMIKEAMEMIKKENPEKIIFENDYQTIWGNGLGPTKIELKKKGTDAVEKLVFNGEKVFSSLNADSRSSNSEVTKNG